MAGAQPVAIYSDLQESSMFWLTACSAMELVRAQSTVKVSIRDSFLDFGQKLHYTCLRGARIVPCALSWKQAHYVEKYYSLFLSGPSQIVKVFIRLHQYFCFNQTFALEIGHSNWQVEASCPHKILK